jgi:Mg2+/Co2+ transporter CorB
MHHCVARSHRARHEAIPLSDQPTLTLVLYLVFLLVLVAFFAGTEVALLTVNRYRLRNRASRGDRSAKLAEMLTRNPDRWLGVNLLWITLTTMAAPTVGTLLAQRYGGDALVWATTVGLGLFTVVFCELAPKIYAAVRPERMALPAAYVYQPLIWISMPVVWVANRLANGFLRLLGVSKQAVSEHSLGVDELRLVVAEAGVMVPQRHQQMLLSILDLEKVTVDDIMVPRNEVVGLDVNDDWDQILNQINQSQHTRMPVYEGELDNIVGILHLKAVARELTRGRFDRDLLIELARSREAYFVPEGTPLNTQLLNFQRQRRRIALVVDEYGDVQGLVTLEDILEEIVGEFTTDPATMMHKDVHPEADGSYVINASVTVRALNRAMQWSLPTDGPKTLNGLIVEYLETIPEPGTTFKIRDYTVEVLQTGENTVKTVRMIPPRPAATGAQVSESPARAPH